MKRNSGCAALTRAISGGQYSSAGRRPAPGAGEDVVAHQHRHVAAQPVALPGQLEQRVADGLPQRRRERVELDDVRPRREVRVAPARDPARADLDRADRIRRVARHAAAPAAHRPTDGPARRGSGRSRGSASARAPPARRARRPARRARRTARRPRSRARSTASRSRPRRAGRAARRGCPPPAPGRSARSPARPGSAPTRPSARPPRPPAARPTPRTPRPAAAPPARPPC